MHVCLDTDLLFSATPLARTHRERSAREVMSEGQSRVCRKCNTARHDIDKFLITCKHCRRNWHHCRFNFL